MYIECCVVCGQLVLVVDVYVIVVDGGEVVVVDYCIGIGFVDVVVEQVYVVVY